MCRMPLFRRKAPNRSTNEPAAVPAAPSEPVVVVTASEVQALLSQVRPELRARLSASGRPAVQYATARLRAGQTMPVGASKIGGLPDLPPGVGWPTWVPATGPGTPRPLAFFAQIDLALVHAHLDVPMPTDGVLQLFSDYDFTGLSDGITGLFNDELQGARVVHIPAGTPLARAVAPPDIELLPEAAVAPLLTWTLPVPEDLDDNDYDACDDVMVQLHALAAAAAPPGFVSSGVHQLGGHAAYIQHPVEEEVVQAVYDVRRRDAGFDVARWEEVSAKTEEWSVLFQLDSDDSLDLMFGDVGTLWWVAPIADMAAGRWDQARFNFQCS